MNQGQPTRRHHQHHPTGDDLAMNEMRSNYHEAELLVSDARTHIENEDQT